MIKVGIAGYGDTGKKRRYWIDQHPDMKVTAICDVNECHVEGIKYFPDYYTMITRMPEEEMHALFICLPNYLAAPVTIMGLNYGLDIFCEKPPGDSLDAVYRVRDTLKQFPKIKLKYGFNHRYHQSVIKAKEMVEQYGKIINMRGVYGKSRLMPFDGNWRSEKQYAGGGILLDQGIHMLDLFRFFAAAEPIRVQSSISSGFYNKDVEDNAYAIIEFEGGIVGMMHSSATLWDHTFNLNIGCEKGFINLTGILSGTRSYGEEKLIHGLRSNHLKGVEAFTTHTFLDDYSWRDEINEFYDCIVNNKPVVNGSIDEAIKSMELVFKIYEEAK